MELSEGAGWKNRLEKSRLTFITCFGDEEQQSFKSRKPQLKLTSF